MELGYEVRVARDGEEGLAVILSAKPDLVVCDVRMPKMSGFEVLKQVAAAGPACARIPFIFLTALGDRESVLQGRKLGADDYLTKPIDFEMLGAVIETRLRRLSQGPQKRSQYHLTEREREVLSWVGRGKTSSEIGTILGLAERTVNFHCDQAMKRLNVTNRAQAVAKAVSEQLLALE